MYDNVDVVLDCVEVHDEGGRASTPRWSWTQPYQAFGIRCQTVAGPMECKERTFQRAVYMLMAFTKRSLDVIGI